MHPNMKVLISTQEYRSALLECRLALSKCQMAPFCALAQRPSSDDKAHLFRSFRRRMSPDSHSTLQGYFLEFSNPYK